MPRTEAERNASMRCNCESSYCEDGGVHRAGGCQETATIQCRYIGGVCAGCAATMRRTGGASYLGGPLPNVRRTTIDGNEIETIIFPDEAARDRYLYERGVLTAEEHAERQALAADPEPEPTDAALENAFYGRPALPVNAGDDGRWGDATPNDCGHDETFPPNDDGEVVCRLCWEVVGKAPRPDEKVCHCGQPLVFVAMMGAPGVGQAWECASGHAWTKIGSSWIDADQDFDGEPPWVMGPEDCR